MLTLVVPQGFLKVDGVNVTQTQNIHRILTKDKGRIIYLKAEEFYWNNIINV